MLRPTTEFSLDPTLFNQAFYDSILKLWLPTYPEASSHFSLADAQRWFGQSDVLDSQIRTLAGDAMSSIGPDHLALPPFTSHEDDRNQAANIAAPFIPHLFVDNVDNQDLHSALALTILLDQLSRNLYRGAAQAVVYTHYDRLARALSSLVSSECHEASSSPVWRFWFLMPLEHSESLAAHETLGPMLREMLVAAKDRGDDMGARFTERAIEFEEQHLQPLVRFGRFPWRNKWLGRGSTEDEEKWLRDGGERFGTG